MDRYISLKLTAENLTPKLVVDDEVQIGAVTRSVVRELERLAPHGPGTRSRCSPLHVKIAGEPKLMGRKKITCRST